MLFISVIIVSYARQTSSYMCVSYAQQPELLTGIDLKKVSRLIGTISLATFLQLELFWVWLVKSFLHYLSCKIINYTLTNV
ncbi:Uncharacterised protein [Yersinia similis]|uniref:Uncharacterized protein n=1 Tax=Yersinia similis TaxID=367190 RepID=A0A0T9R0V5_9GAMM|nr:Uncharacterised protein [Yersinia similis]CNB95056.1 Uncharacterised protein [Yersinia similis]CNF20356.1 Uncharacterised protein [Yersinia similis]CNG24573.1 Uncharacterised protein [Yersinia similis]CNI38710.1 Uncharacterised protein [Yersinia similis]